MVRILFVAILVLMPLLALAQSPTFAVDVRPVWAKQVLDLHDNQLSSSFQKPRVEFGALAEFRRIVHVKYVIKPGFAYQERTEVTQSLIVGSTEFGPKKDEKEAKVVDLEWRPGLEQRLELSTMQGLFNFPIQPIFIGEWSSVDLTATSSKKNSSEVTTDSERFSRFVCGFGGTLRLTNYPDPANRNIPRIMTTITAVGSPQLQRFEAQIMYRASPNIALTGGYSSQTKDLGGLKWREHGPFVSVLWAF